MMNRSSLATIASLACLTLTACTTTTSASAPAPAPEAEASDKPVAERASLFQVAQEGEAPKPPPQCRTPEDGRAWVLDCNGIASRLSKVGIPSSMLQSKEGVEIFWSGTIAAYQEEGWTSAEIDPSSATWEQAAVPVRAWRVSHQGVPRQDVYVGIMRLSEEIVHTFHCSIPLESDPAQAGCDEALAYLSELASSQSGVTLTMGEETFDFADSCQLFTQSVQCQNESSFGVMAWWEFDEAISDKEVQSPEVQLRLELDRLGAQVVEMPNRCKVAGAEATCTALLYQLPDTAPQLVLWAYGSAKGRRYRLVCDAVGMSNALPEPCSTLIDLEVLEEEP